MVSEEAVGDLTAKGRAESLVQPLELLEDFQVMPRIFIIGPVQLEAKEKSTDQEVLLNGVGPVEEEITAHRQEPQQKEAIRAMAEVEVVPVVALVLEMQIKRLAAAVEFPV